jgi:hypothetical protein
MAVTLQQAFAAARRRCPGDQWLLMSPGEQTRVIYQEMRRLDLEQALVRGALAISAGQPVAPLRSFHRRSNALDTGEVRATRCCAAVRTRSSGQCAWKATMFVDGAPYCGFHARLGEVQRARACVAVAAD